MDIQFSKKDVNTKKANLLCPGQLFYQSGQFFIACGTQGHLVIELPEGCLPCVSIKTGDMWFVDKDVMIEVFMHAKILILED